MEAQLRDLMRELAAGELGAGALRFDELMARRPAPTGGGGGALRRLRCGAAEARRLAAAAAAPPAADARLGLEDAVLVGAARLRAFLGARQEALWARLVAAVGALSPGAGGCGGEGLAAVEAALDAAGTALVALQRFARVNVAALALLARRADGGAAAPAAGGAYVAAARRFALGGQAPDPLLVGLSDAYAALRRARAGGGAAAADAAAWTPPVTFRRLTKKFLLHPADVPAFKAEVVRHLPVLLYAPGGAPRAPLGAGAAPAPPLAAARAAAPRDGAPVASVYLDDPVGGGGAGGDPPQHSQNPPRKKWGPLGALGADTAAAAGPREALPAYHARLRRRGGAAVVRLRWYGRRAPRDARAPLFVERKVRRGAAAGAPSAKERAPLPQGGAAAFLAGGALPRAADAGRAAFLAGAQAAVVAARARPLLRTAYYRTAFQAADNNLVRISLDVDLCMAREFDDGGGGAGWRAPGDWCRSDLDLLPDAEDEDRGGGGGEAPEGVHHFPYAVVEVKLQAAPPPWLQRLVGAGALLPAPKFSKYLHGVAALYQPLCSATPHWFLPEEGGGGGQGGARLTPATWEELADPRCVHAAAAAGWLFGGGGAAGAGGAAGDLEAGGGAARAPDAKALFAAERTLMHWVQAGVVAMLLAMALLSGGGGAACAGAAGGAARLCAAARAAGAAAAPAALGFLAYALATYRARTAALLRREGGAPAGGAGPAAVAGALLAALLVSFVVAAALAF